MTEDWISKLVAGGLKQTINAHGPITLKWIGSAAKRIANWIFGELRRQQILQTGHEECLSKIKELQKEIYGLKQQKSLMNQSLRYWRKKAEGIIIMKDYQKTIEDIAREIIIQKGFNEQNWHDPITERVYSNSFIMFYGNNEEVLDNTKNEPDNREVLDMAGNKASWRDIRRIAATMAMERDVWGKCRELKDEYFECEGCGNVFHGEEAHSLVEGEYCKDCVLECSSCGDEFDKESDQGEPGKPLCENCVLDSEER